MRTERLRTERLRTVIIRVALLHVARLTGLWYQDNNRGSCANYPPKSLADTLRHFVIGSTVVTPYVAFIPELWLSEMTISGAKHAHRREQKCRCNYSASVSSPAFQRPSRALAGFVAFSTFPATTGSPTIPHLICRALSGLVSLPKRVVARIFARYPPSSDIF